MDMAAISDDMREFIEGLPKAELHVYLEGTLGPETLLRLAARNGLEYPLKTVRDVEDASITGRSAW